jgi:ubiquinone/menaquinone biosynthesis C-methylase UbiE
MTSTLPGTPAVARLPYIIRGGADGRARLRVLFDATWPGTEALFERLEIRPGMRCLDAGCGAGDVTAQLARLVAPHGRVLGVDVDEGVIAVARAEAAGVHEAEYAALDLTAAELSAEFDLVYARFVLTHVRDPQDVAERLLAGVRPGGIVALEDIDLGGVFGYPEHDAARRAYELYRALARRRGCDHDIGLRLPAILAAAGCDDVQVRVTQPAGAQARTAHERAAKHIVPMTLEAIGDAAVSEGLSERDELELLVAELRELADDERVFLSMPRVVQAWARCR